MKKILICATLLCLVACSKTGYEEHLKQAQDFIQQNEFSAAEIEIKNAIKLKPENGKARFILGKLYLDSNRYEQAEKEFNRALEYKYPINEVMPLLSLSYHKSGTDVELAKIQYKNAGIKPEQAAEIAFYQLQAFTRLNQNEKAISKINEIKNIDTDSSFKTLALAYDMLLKENVDAATLLIDEVLVKKENHAEALKLKAHIHLSRGEKEQAADVYQKYYQSFPEDHQIAFSLARLLTELNKTAQAEKIIDSLLAISSKNTMLNRLKAVALYNQKNFEDAIIYAEKAINLAPNDAVSRTVAGISAYYLKDPQKSNYHLSEVADKLPEEHPGLRILAASQLALGQAMEANDTIAQFKALDQKDAALLSSIGLSLIKSGETDKAKVVAAKASDISESAEALTQLGLLQLSLNDIEGLSALEQANTIAEDQNASQKTLATAYLSTGRYNKALELSKQWKNQQNNNSQAYILAAISYLRLGDATSAKTEVEQLLSIEQNNIQALMILSEVEDKAGNKAQSLSLLTQLLAKEPLYIPALIKHYLLAKEKGQAKDVVLNIKQLFASNSDNKSLRLLLARLQVMEQQFDDAIILLASDNTDDYVNTSWDILAKAYWGKGDFAKTAQHFERWLSAEPNSKPALLGNLMLLDGKRKYEQGLTLSTDYLAKNSNDVEMQLLNTHFLIMTGKIKLAKAQLSKLPAKVMELPFTKGLLGYIQMSDGDYAEAEQNLFQSYEHAAHARNVRMLYLSLLKQNKNEQGLKFLQSHMSKYPKDLASMMLLANSQIQINQDDAIKSYEKVLTLQSNNFIALNNLAYFYLQRSELKKAQEYAEKALAQKPRQADILDTLAQILIAKKDYQKALKHLSIAVESKNVKEEIYLNYIEALALNDQLLLAQRKVEQKDFNLPNSQQRLQQLKQKYGLK